MVLVIEVVKLSYNSSLTLSLKTEVLRKRKESENAKTHKEFSINKTKAPLCKNDK